jgi:hypothetical protein
MSGKHGVEERAMRRIVVLHLGLSSQLALRPGLSASTGRGILGTSISRIYSCTAGVHARSRLREPNVKMTGEYRKRSASLSMRRKGDTLYQ